jgi:phosphatidylserine decarboxylase
MRIHREGWTSIFIALMVVIAGAWAIHTWVPYLILRYLGTLVLWVLFFLVVYFFRNPTRITRVGDNEIVAPCDGKVVVIEATREDEVFKEEVRQISIFMSPLNVHVNRYPIGGEVEYAKYHPGKYLVAWHPKSSTENERTTVVVAQNGVRILFRQIAGALARRIVLYAKEGDKASTGGEMGFIKFGSRMDIFVPLDAEIAVDLNQKTVGGKTVIARIPNHA